MAGIQKQTVYANAQSRKLDQQNAMTSGKIVHIAGKLDDFYGEPNTVFQQNIGETTPDFDNPLGHYVVASGSMMRDPNAELLQFNPYDQYAEALKVWGDYKAQYGSKIAEKKIATGNIVNTQTINATKSLNILDRVLGLQVRDFFLQQVVTPVPSPQLVFTVDEYAEGSVQGKVPELDEAELISHTETRTTKILYKNVGHIAISEEADMMASHPTMQLRQDKTMKDMARLINTQIATEMANATDVAGSDWGSIETTNYGDNDNNPMDDIQPVMTTIEGNGFNVDYIAGHDSPITKLAVNKFIRGRGNVGIGTNVLSTHNVNETGIPPMVKDQALPTTTALVGSKDAVWLGQGATAVANYVNDQAGFRGWLVKQWWLPYLAQSGAIRELTGVAT
jgi:hypothetical protein